MDRSCKIIALVLLALNLACAKRELDELFDVHASEEMIEGEPHSKQSHTKQMIQRIKEKQVQMHTHTQVGSLLQVDASASFGGDPPNTSMVPVEVKVGSKKHNVITESATAVNVAARVLDFDENVTHANRTQSTARIDADPMKFERSFVIDTRPKKLENANSSVTETHDDNNTSIGNSDLLQVADQAKDSEHLLHAISNRPEDDWDEKAETAAVALLLAYKLTHSQLCPDVLIPGMNGIADAYTYGIGCKHPSVTCSCPKWFMEECLDNTFPIQKFGRCRIAIWFWCVISVLGLACICGPIAIMKSKSGGSHQQELQNAHYPAGAQDAQAYYGQQGAPQYAPQY